jgi:hypothetical protein
MHICANFGCIIMKGSIDVDILWSFGIATCFVRAPCHFASRACSIAWHYLPINIDVFHIKCSHLLTSKMVLNHLYRRICVMTLSLHTCFPLKNTLLSLNQASKGVGVGFGSIFVWKWWILLSTVRTMFAQNLTLYHERSTKNLATLKHKEHDASCIFMSMCINESQCATFLVHVVHRWTCPLTSWPYPTMI